MAQWHGREKLKSTFGCHSKNKTKSSKQSLGNTSEDQGGTMDSPTVPQSRCRVATADVTDDGNLPTACEQTSQSLGQLGYSPSEYERPDCHNPVVLLLDGQSRVHTSVSTVTSSHQERR